MPSAPSTPARRPSNSIAAIGVLLGIALYAHALASAHSHPLRGSLWATAALASVTAALTWVRSGRRGAAPKMAAWLFALLLSPAVLLLSVPSAYASSLGWAHALSLAALVLVAVAPLALALRAASLDDGTLTRWHGNTLSVTVSLLLGLTGAEVGVRLSGNDPGDPLPRFRETPLRTVRSPIARVGWELAPDQTWKTIYPSNERGYFDADGSVSYRINDVGYRGAPFARERRPGTRRVALLGDSFAFGLGVKEDDTVARRLEEALGRNASCPTEVLSFAVPGYSTDQEEALLRRRVLRYAPDVAVVWYFLNDVEITGTLAFLGGDHARGFFPLARRASALARLIGTRLDAQLSLATLVRTYEDAYQPSDPHWRTVEQAFARLGRTARERSVRIVVCVHPILFRLGPAYPFAHIHQQVIDAARRAGLDAVDLAAAFDGTRPEDLWVHRSDQHPNEIAHALAARFSAERIRPLLPPCASAGR